MASVKAQAMTVQTIGFLRFGLSIILTSYVILHHLEPQEALRGR
jgi:hypothetical protein